MHRTLLLLLLFIQGLCASAQMLKGSITTVTGEPIPFATVYIRETTSGLVTDEQGQFQVKLKEGYYTCEFRLLGYEPQVKVVEVGPNGNRLEIKLAIKEQKLDEVTVRPSKEDPAVQIMRRAIARAPYHRYQVQSFRSDNYLKGSVKIESIPSLMKMMIKDNKLKSLIGKLLVLESQNQISFQTPNKYTQHVVAYKSSIPKEIEPKGGMRITTSNIYDALYDEVVSPLAANAFQYYEFKLIQVSEYGKYEVNKIRITPRIKKAPLYNGDIYIIQDDWSVYSLDLTISQMGTDVRTKVNFQEVQPTVFMPITYDSYSNIGTMGVKGFARYYSSVKYHDIQLNPTVAKYQQQMAAESNRKELSEKEKKRLSKIEELSAKEHLSTGDAVKLAKLMTASIEPKEVKKRKQSMEIKDENRVKMEIDTLAAKRDSSYWEETRNVPLQKDEILSFKRADSIAAPKSVKTTNNSVEISMGGNNGKMGWLMGSKIKLNKRMTLRYSGLADAISHEYNFVDGFWLGQGVQLGIDSNLYISPSVYYVTARKTAVWDTWVKYNYAPMSGGEFSLQLGNSSEDIQNGRGASRTLNSLSSMLSGHNIIRFYQSKYISLQNKIDVANGLQLTTAVGFDKRHLLSNNTSYHFFGKSILPNSPDSAYSAAFPDHYNTSIYFRLDYTPFHRYRIKKGRKVYADPEYPTFGLEYKKAIPLLDKAEQSSYDRLTFSIEQDVKLSIFDHLKYAVEVGGFLSKDRLYARDFAYFQTNPIAVSFASFDRTFNLLDNYTASQSRWLETHIAWNSDYLLLKRLPFMQRYVFSESLHLNTLWNMRNERPYLEAGYSVGIDPLARLGVFTGFDGTTFRSVGVKLSLSIFSLVGIR